MKKAVVHLIAAARPNFMKVAPLYHQLVKESWAEPKIVHTGQHYDFNMSDSFFQDLRLPPSHFHLGVGSGSHAAQTGGVMISYDTVLDEETPNAVVVVGDVNSTVACSLVAVKRGIFTAHLEAGLRSRDRTMPEEINRIVTDSISDLLWTPSPDGTDNLLNEGVSKEKIEMVGNIMMDSLEMVRSRFEGAGTPARLGLPLRNYAVVTFHRPSNVDSPAVLREIVENLVELSYQIPIFFPIHPRTRQRLESQNLLSKLEVVPNITLSEPATYIDFLSLIQSAKVVITDSGGIQEETTYLRIPCLTMRENTERPITVTQGTNRLTTLSRLLKDTTEVLSKPPKGGIPELWDGKTSERVARSLRSALGT